MIGIKKVGTVYFNDALYCEWPQKVVSDSQRRITIVEQSPRLRDVYLLTTPATMDNLCVGPANTKKNLCAISKIKNRFAFADCVAICLICTARSMGYKANHKVCFFNHPSVSMRYCISWWSAFNFGVNNGVILCRLVF